MKKRTTDWIEIVSVRLFNTGHRKAVRNIYREVSAGSALVPDDVLAADLYVNDHVETDWSIYLYRNGRDIPPSKTLLGLTIAEAFNALGLVDHSVWTTDLMKKETDHEEKERN